MDITGHKKNIILIVIITLLTFANSLLNGFVGDDEFLFIKNSFFHSWENFPRLFSSDYIADQDAIFNDDSEDINSGSVAYRPVLSATFFLDYGLWKDKAFGFHLQNVVLHIINSLLVYWLVLLVVGNPLASLLAALLFSVHPLRSEAVCSIGYRADSLAALFVLLSFIFYVLREKKGAGWLALSYLSFLLAVFSKESAVILPALVVSYDWLIRRENAPGILKGLFSRYLGFIVVLLFYLYVYLFVFPNSSLKGVPEISSSLSVQVVTILRILSHYLTVFFLPFLVKLLPPLYVPRIDILWGLKTWTALGVVFIYAGVLVYLLRKNKESGFFLLWFFFAFIPVSNVIVIANPMAYRFMYLPSVGLSVFAALMLTGLKPWLSRFSEKLFGFLTAGLLGLCVLVSVFLNFNWKSTTMMALGMVKDFPDYPVGYLHAGMTYFNAGMNDKAKELLLKSVELELDDPRGLYVLGLIAINDLKESRQYFEECVRQFPAFAHAYTGLGRINLMEKRYDEALYYFNKSIQLSPNWKVYAYLAQIFLVQNNDEALNKLLEKGWGALTQKEYGALEEILTIIKKDRNKFPIDLGV